MKGLGTYSPKSALFFSVWSQQTGFSSPKLSDSQSRSARDEGLFENQHRVSIKRHAELTTHNKKADYAKQKFLIRIPDSFLSSLVLTILRS